MPLVKTICGSLAKYHRGSCEKAIQMNKSLEPSLFVDDVFTHEEAITHHLHLLKFILQEGSMYLNFSYAQEIWDVLITNSKSCDWDKFVGFTLFIDCILDLNEDSRIDIFKKQILKLKPSQLTLKGYECFKLYFLKVNEHEAKIFPRNDDFVSLF
jgi:ubiquitin carboxyl-terminal hydrolase 9/24